MLLARELRSANSISPFTAPPILQVYAKHERRGGNAYHQADGFERQMYLVNGEQPGPLIDVDEGDDVEVFVQNDLDVDTTIHWHGLLQRGTPQMDGVPGVSQEPIPPGGNFTYRFSTGSEYGFFWYHSHVRAYYNDAIRGPLLIRPAASRKRPFASLARNDDDSDALHGAERDATNILLNDWTHELSDVVFSRYLKTGAFPSCVDSILANGKGRVQCLPKDDLEAGPGLGIEPNSTAEPMKSTATSGEHVRHGHVQTRPWTRHDNGSSHEHGESGGDFHHVNGRSCILDRDG
ncbi:cupredoxin [Fusarium albosuccineum]|uniref:Cupredoxin n=1 Tax=Fusarium albosuccineum TaxID=1237068 RepID=A0A8H4PG19_9HYPO|nr:cupredoxin [Fusarium albosuccineum]